MFVAMSEMSRQTLDGVKWYLRQTFSSWTEVYEASFFLNHANQFLPSSSPGSRLPAPYGCIWWEHPEESFLPGVGEAEARPLQPSGRAPRHCESLLVSPFSWVSLFRQHLELNKASLCVRQKDGEKHGWQNFQDALTNKILEVMGKK